MLPATNGTAEPPRLSTDFLWTGIEGKKGVAIALNLPHLLLRRSRFFQRCRVGVLPVLLHFA